jgi:hypothetical protein
MGSKSGPRKIREGLLGKDLGAILAAILQRALQRKPLIAKSGEIDICRS